MPNAKGELRILLRARRDAMPLGERIEKGERIAERLFALPEFRKARRIAFFLSIGSEVNTRWMIERALRLGKKVLIPVTRKEIELVGFPGWEGLRPGRFGVPEPLEPKRTGLKPDIVVVPGLAFDRRGARLGYGKGYYDRLLRKSKAIRIAVAFEGQLVERVPESRGDESMDFLITETRTVRTHAR